MSYKAATRMVRFLSGPAPKPRLLAQSQFKNERQVRPEIYCLVPEVAVKLNLEQRRGPAACCEDAILDDGLRHRRAQRRGRDQSQARDLTNANRVIREPLLTLSPPHKTQVHPHGLLDARFADVVAQRFRQIRRPVLPRRKRRLCRMGIGRPETNAERRGMVFPARPSLPEQRAPRAVALRFFGVAHPEQFNHGVDEGKTPVRRTLAGMLTGRSLPQAELNQLLCLGRPEGGADEEMVQFHRHASECNLVFRALAFQKKYSANPGATGVLDHRYWRLQKGVNE